MKNKFIVIKHKRKDYTYISIATSNGYGKGYGNQVGIGRLEKLEELSSDPINVIKNVCETLSITEFKRKNQAKYYVCIKFFKTEVYNVNYGINILYDLINKFEIFDALPKTRHKELNKILKYTIASRIIDANSYISIHKNKYKYEDAPNTSKDSYYALLNLIYDNKENLLKRINEKVIKNTSRKVELVFYDLTTMYFESFSRLGLRHSGYSKDGKFKEDQVVVGMATDENGIPIHIETFKGNTANSKTFIPFVLEMSKIYEIKNVTIIADKGMSTSSNIRFLEQKGINYIISYRLKSGAKSFKDFVLDESNYVGNENFKHKEETIVSLYNKKRPNGKLRRRIVTFSKKRALKDKADRQNLIDNFNKLKNKNGLVETGKLTGGKKYKFFKKVGKAFYELDYKKVQEDSQFDGYYIYETSRMDLTSEEIVEIYAKQWQIEENFRTMKSSLQVRPMYVWTDKHIEAHILLCFMSLVIMKFLLYSVNKTLKDTGVIDRFSNERVIKAIKSAEKVVKVVDGQIKEEIYIRNTQNSDYISDFETIQTIFSKIVQVI
ncbi:IS1634 family transposase [Mycoplasma seminis]|uniref:IS1634 family transposase n=2 Tax=Mycoplasma seminis TaxID=512749 RepID=A0ABY9HA88_9MOLU|nr:IS1634 family transposase [Mycoplasma seminis]WLP85502.1 IS1634 family transposase [Mycoplasma seminis]